LTADLEKDFDKYPEAEDDASTGDESHEDDFIEEASVPDETE
jgi:hypothetical protein